MSSSPLPLLGWTGESQHGEADVLRSVSSREAGPYRSLPVREIVKGCGPTQIRVSITKKKVLWKKIFSIDKINSWHHFLVCVVCTSLYCDVVKKTLSQMSSLSDFSAMCALPWKPWTSFWWPATVRASTCLWRVSWRWCESCWSQTNPVCRS